MAEKDNRFEQLPLRAAGYIKAVVKRIRYSLRVRREVCRELIAHFTDALSDCADDSEKDRRAGELIEAFGDTKLLAGLIRRGKKRCRPLWKKAIVRSFQALGLLGVAFCLHTVWFVTGRPTISVDYLSILNDRSRPTAPADQNAWENYKRAMDLHVEPGEDIADVLCRYKSPAELTPSEQTAIKKWIEDNESAWREFSAGSRKQYCWFEYSTREAKAPLVTIALPPLGRLRSLSRMCPWRARIALEDGHAKEAMEDCLVVARVGRHYQKRLGTLIEQLVGLAMSTLAHTEIMRIADSPKCSAANLAQAQEQLEALYPDGYPMMDLESERLCFLDAVQRYYTQGGPGGGHLIPGEFLRFSSSWEFENFIFSLAGVFYARRDETVAKGNKYYRQANEIIKLSPYQRCVQNLQNWWCSNYVWSPGKIRSPLLRTFTPSVGHAGELAYQGKASYEATVTVLALRQWRLEKGHYPENLQQLVSDGCLKTLPADPYSDGPLKYKRRGEDFVLYSVGADFTDDSGARDKDWNSWEEPNTDHIFWPVR